MWGKLEGGEDGEGCKKQRGPREGLRGPGVTTESTGMRGKVGEFGGVSTARMQRSCI